MEIKCSHCSKLFEPTRHVANRIKREPDKKRYCSNACKGSSTKKLYIPFPSGTKEYRAAYYEMNKEKANKQSAEYFQKNKEKLRKARAVSNERYWQSSKGIAAKKRGTKVRRFLRSKQKYGEYAEVDMVYKRLMAELGDGRFKGE